MCWPLSAASVAVCGCVCDVIVEWNVVSGGGSVWSDCEYLQLCTLVGMYFDLSLSVCGSGGRPAAGNSLYMCVGPCLLLVWQCVVVCVM